MSELSLVEPRSLLTSVSDDCGLPSLSSVLYTKGELKFGCNKFVSWIVFGRAHELA